MENHKVMLENRQTAEISDIREIISFDDKEIRAALKEGEMVIRGENLNIRKLDLSEALAVIGGRIDSLMYLKTKEKGEKGIIARILK